MPTFDLSEVRDFTADLDARMRRCENGEGTECATVDAALCHYAGICCQYVDAVRAWGRAVFRGDVAFDAEVERVWKEEGTRLLAKASEQWTFGSAIEAPCYELGGLSKLSAALYAIRCLFDHWVSPQRSVSPVPRQGFPVDPETLSTIRGQLAALPPLPPDWQPDDASQKALYRRLRGS